MGGGQHTDHCRDWHFGLVVVCLFVLFSRVSLDTSGIGVEKGDCFTAGVCKPVQCEDKGLALGVVMEDQNYQPCLRKAHLKQEMAGLFWENVKGAWLKIEVN